MERSAEFWRGCLYAIDDLPGMPEHLRLEWINRRIEIYTGELAAAEAREVFPIPDTLPEVPEVREAFQPTAAEVIAACEKHIADTLEGMPEKIDPRMKYREVQYRDSELDEMRALLSIIARWKEANHGK